MKYLLEYLLYWMCMYVYIYIYIFFFSKNSSHHNFNFFDGISGIVCQFSFKRLKDLNDFSAGYESVCMELKPFQKQFLNVNLSVQNGLIDKL